MGRASRLARGRRCEGEGRKAVEGWLTYDITPTLTTMSRIGIVLAFIACTIIGTLSHEFGHITVAKSLGYETELHYASMDWYDTELRQQRDSLSQLLAQPTISAARTKELEASFSRTFLDERIPALLISVGGPAQTLLFGFTGFTLLILRRNKPSFTYFDWGLVFLTLFLSRMVANPIISATLFSLGKSESLITGDEQNIARLLRIDPVLISGSLFLISLACCSYTVFWLIPKQYRWRFFTWGLIGSGLGFITWMMVLGPRVLS